MNRTYTYDAENRLIAVDGGAVSYQYDASGRRVRKTVGGSTTEYVLDLEGRVVQEYGPSLSLVRTELFAGGQHLGTYRDGVTYFSHTDWLGTERARTNMAGAVVETFTSLPFGDALSSPGSVSPLHFTGKERDAETYDLNRRRDAPTPASTTVSCTRKSTSEPIGSAAGPARFELHQRSYSSENN